MRILGNTRKLQKAREEADDSSRLVIRVWLVERVALVSGSNAERTKETRKFTFDTTGSMVKFVWIILETVLALKAILQQKIFFDKDQCDRTLPKI